MWKNQKKLEELLRDPDLLDLVNHLLEYDQKKRITAEQALQHRFFKTLREKEELEKKEKLRKESRRVTSSNSQSQSRSRSRKREREKH